MSQKNLYTFEMAAEWKEYDSGGKGLGVWIAYGLRIVYFLFGSHLKSV